MGLLFEERVHVGRQGRTKRAGEADGTEAEGNEGSRERVACEGKQDGREGFMLSLDSKIRDNDMT